MISFIVMSDKYVSINVQISREYKQTPITYEHTNNNQIQNDEHQVHIYKQQSHTYVQMVIEHLQNLIFDLRRIAVHIHGSILTLILRYHV